VKHRIGLLSLSDGRGRVHDGLAPVIEGYNDKLVAALEATGEVEVVRAATPLNHPETVRREAERLKQAGVQGAIFHQPVFGFPHFAVIAAQILEPPFLVLSPREPNYPSLVGLLTIGAAFAQLEIPHLRMWGDVEEPEVLAGVLAFVRAAAAVRRLRGQVYGLLGGRSMGLYGAAPAPNLWLRTFGVDTDHVDQFEIVRRAGLVSPERVALGVNWLAERVGSIHYDDSQLTPAKLEQQVRAYLATKDIVADYGWDFLGLKCHYEMSEYHVVQCLSASLLNDPYDWEGPKEPTMASCEADSDGALSMQLLKLLSGRPVALLDVRFYDRQASLWVLSNCGAATTWFAARSDDPAENLARVQLVPATPKYLAGGAHLCFQFRAGPVTLARLQRAGERYQLVILKGHVEERPLEAVSGSSSIWPLAFVRLDVPVESMVAGLHSNHLHLVAGDFTRELRLAAQFLGIETVSFQAEG
jgi:L-fucose isomerase